MDEHQWLAERFEEHRTYLRAVAYRMLGSLAEADDAVQDAWLRFGRSNTSGVANLGGWLTTIVARVCLDMLQSRRSRRVEPLDEHVAAPVDGIDPEREAILADSVGSALLVVLDTLAPAARLAFVLHDLLAVPLDEIAPIVERSPVAARQLASRARRRVQGAAAVSADLTRQRTVVEAFLAARATVTSTRCSRCLTRMSCSAPTRRPCRPPRPGGLRAPRPWRARSAARRLWSTSTWDAPRRRNQRSSTERWAPCGLRTGSNGSCSTSPSRREDRRDRPAVRSRASPPARRHDPERRSGG